MERSRKIIRVSLIGIAVNLVLVVFKAFVGLATGSIAVIMDAVNNLSDALSSTITIVGTRLAGKAPDKKHPYGYGQIEYVTSVTIAVVIILTGLTSFRGSLEKIIYPEAADYNTISLIIIAVAVLVKFGLGRFVKKQGQKYNSESLIASGTDAVFDSVISFSTLIAAGLSIMFGLSIEGWLGIIIAVMIFKAGIEILLESLSGIIGERVESSLALELKKRICEYPQVNGAYDLILHRYGPEKIIGSVHIEIPDELTAREIHSLSYSISEDMYINYGIILTVGIYASNTADGLFAQMKASLAELVENYPEVLQMHGFYVDEEKKSVSFDLIIDFKSGIKQQIKDEILKCMAQAYPDYKFNAVLDNDFSE
ncbi:MAG: cation transporter [Lachnospiraceae bacterium]|nr:cation transporter [Lachnospiraceae bacterium]